jgi:hypothetical protein
VTVADLQRHLGDLAAFLELAKAGAAAKELCVARDALQPFSSRTIKDFASFLARADEFDRTGSLESATRKSTPRAAKADASEAALAARRLYDRATDPSVTSADIEELIGQLSRLTVAGLVQVATTLGLRGMERKKKDEIVREIRRTIEGRRESYQRAGMAHAMPGQVSASES